MLRRRWFLYQCRLKVMPLAWAALETDLLMWKEEPGCQKKSRSNEATRLYCTQSTPCDMHLNLVPTVFVCSMAMLQLIVFASLSPLSRKLLILLSRLQVDMMLCCAHSRRKYKSKVQSVLTSEFFSLVLSCKSCCNL